MHRIAVVGTPGSGKTTVARDLAERLDLVHIELDGLFHQTGWQPLDRDELRRRLVVRMDAATTGWTVCGNYTAAAGDILRTSYSAHPLPWRPRLG